jgi:hypothetical protein
MIQLLFLTGRNHQQDDEWHDLMMDGSPATD